MTNPAFIYPQLLRPGDRLSLDEFLDRWNCMPELKSAELIDGTVYLPSPVSVNHGNHDNHLQGVIALYRFRTPGVEALANTTWLMTASGAPQPDCSVRILPEYGGRSTTRDGLAVGVPDLVVEICYSSRSFDLGPKLALYQSAGVREYLAILVEESRFEWRNLVNGSYQFLPADAGIYRSLVLPGLWINETSFWNQDSDTLMQTLDAGLASSEHADFVRHLQAGRDRRGP